MASVFTNFEEKLIEKKFGLKKQAKQEINNIVGCELSTEQIGQIESVINKVNEEYKQAIEVYKKEKE